MVNKQERGSSERNDRNGTKRAKWVTLVALALVAVLAFPLAANALANTGAQSAVVTNVEPNEPAEDPAAEAAENAALAGSAKLTADEAKQALVDAGTVTAEEAKGAIASLENENGRIVYAVTIGQTEYKVDAATGEVILDSEADVEYEG